MVDLKVQMNYKDEKFRRYNSNNYQNNQGGQPYQERHPLMANTGKSAMIFDDDRSSQTLVNMNQSDISRRGGQSALHDEWHDLKNRRVNFSSKKQVNTHQNKNRGRHDDDDDGKAINVGKLFTAGFDQSLALTMDHGMGNSE